MSKHRPDLDTLEGRMAAEAHGRRVHERGRAYRFTEADRRRGRETQRQQGRFRGGKFRQK